nr:hypothetical protein [Tanacetum cinerariifolium]
MDQDFAHMVAASNVLMLKPGEFEIWRIRIKQYIQMIDYALWEVIENGSTLPKIQVMKGITTVMPITSVKDKALRRLEVKVRSTLMMGIPNEHPLKFNSVKDANQLLEAIEKRFEMLDQTFDRLQKLVIQLELLGEKHSQEDVNQKLLRSLSSEWNTHVVAWRNKTDLDTMSMNDLYNNLQVYEPEVKEMSRSNSNTQNMAFLPQLTHEDLEQIHPNDIKEMDLRWQMAMLTMRAKRFLKKTRRKLTVNGNESLGFDMSKVECHNYYKRRHFARECRAIRNQDTKHKESTRKSVLVETPTSIDLVSCDGLGGYDWSDQAEEGPNYALMAYTSLSSDSKVSNVSTCLKSCLESIKLIKYHNEQLLKDLKKSELMVLGYKIAIKELRRKLEVAQKEKEGIQLTVEKLENESKSLNKLIDCQIVDNYKKVLGYESYNAVSPPYTGNFMPLKHDLSYTGLDKFVVKPVVENKSSEVETKAVRKNPDATIVEEWVLLGFKTKTKVIDHVSKHNSASITLKKFDYIDAQGTKDEISGIVKSFITRIENLVYHKVKVIRCDNGTEFKNREMNQFYELKGILRQYSVARTPQQNRVAERRNRTLIEAAKTMLADSKLLNTFWSETVNTGCYVQNRVLVVKPYNKTPYELFHSRTPTLSFMRPFGCPAIILNTKDYLGKFDGKADEGFFVGYSLNSKASRVFNRRTRIVEENLHIRFSESTPNVVGSGSDWLFDIDTLTKIMNYEPIVASTYSNSFEATKASDNAGQVRKETAPVKDYILLPLWTTDPLFLEYSKNQEKQDNVNNTKTVNVASTNEVNDVGENISIKLQFNPSMPTLEDIGIFDFLNKDEDDDSVAYMNDLVTTIQVSPTLTTRIHKDHPLDQVIKDLHSATQTRNMLKDLEDMGLLVLFNKEQAIKTFKIACLLAFYYKKNPK